jgi:Raf kinase inhibitor-like YbhB/YbcL family protein
MRVHISKRALIYFAVIDVALIFGAVWFFSSRRASPAPVGLEDFAKGGMRVVSPAFDQNGPIPAHFACARAGGDNVSPPLGISGVPAGAKSLALVVEDPDTSFGTWTHWTMWNLSPHLTELREGAVPLGAVQGANSAREKSYGGPCPPQGTHRYFFKLYALDDMPQLSDDLDPQALRRVIEPHVIGQAVLVGTFRKP